MKRIELLPIFGMLTIKLSESLIDILGGIMDLLCKSVVFLDNELYLI
jgi:hypothetical protein